MTAFGGTAKQLQIITALGLLAVLAMLTRLALLDFAESSDMFHPHGFCYLWQPPLVSAHVIADGLIGLSYIAISGTLVYLVWRARRLLPFSWIFIAFGVFIIACGATHLMEIVTLWYPLFWLSANFKIVTAIASVATAAVLPPLLPKVLDVVQAAHVSEQRRVALENAHADLERRVEERTAQLQKALERAEDAARSKEAFLGTVSHELRTPLNAIMGWSKMLSRGDGDEAFLRRGLDVIDRNATIQAQLVEDLLDVSQLSEGTLRLQLRPVDLVRVVADAVEVVRPSADAKQVAITVPQGPAQLALMGEPRRLQQIVWNLLSNAIKFTPTGGLVTVSVVQRDGHALIEVRDTGIGIDQSFLPRVFDRFSQADSSSTRPHRGVGLGLAIARQLTELHGGTVHATSPGLGSGTTLTVDLPLGRNVLLGDDVRGSHRPAAADLTGIRVLVVDDEADAREALGLMLARSGASVTTAASADEAFAQLSSATFDVVVSDIAMPSRDGYDLIAQIRRSADERVRQTPAIAVSAYAREDDRRRTLTAGFQLHIAKPVFPDELVGAVDALLPR